MLVSMFIAANALCNAFCSNKCSALLVSQSQITFFFCVGVQKKGSTLRILCNSSTAVRVNANCCKFFLDAQKRKQQSGYMRLVHCIYSNHQNYDKEYLVSVTPQTTRLTE